MNKILTTHAERQAILWKKCVTLNKRHPIGSKVTFANVEGIIETEFSVIQNTIVVTIDGKQKVVKSLPVE